MTNIRLISITSKEQLLINRKKLKLSDRKMGKVFHRTINTHAHLRHGKKSTSLVIQQVMPAF